MVEALKLIPAGWAEGGWCLFNWSFVTPLIALGVSATLLITIPGALGRLRGPAYEDPKPAPGPVGAEANQDQATKAKSNRCRRLGARAAGWASWFACVGAIATACYLYLALDGKTKCDEIHGKFEAATAANCVAALYILLAVAILGRLLMWIASRNLPAQTDG